MSTSLVADVPAMPPPLSGADVNGWSAVALFASADAPRGSWVFVMGARRAWLSAGPLSDARFMTISADFAGRWPFADGTLAGVVIDGDSLLQGSDGRTLEGALLEARRVTVHGAPVLVACTHRMVPRSLRSWRDYGRSSLPAFQQAMAGVGHATVGWLTLDGSRVTELTPGRSGSSPSHVDRTVLRAGWEDRDTVLRALVEEASRACGLRLTPDRVAVRKIGKTAVFLAGADGARRIMRIARSPIARARAANNFETLARLRTMALPEPLTGRVPVPVAQGERDGFAFFVETCLDGEAGPWRGRRSGHAWAPGAVEYITALHAATQRDVTIDGDLFERLVAKPLARLGQVCTSPEAVRVLRLVRRSCEEALAGARLPLVQTHGDFTESNCLFDSAGGVTGVVDWEVSLTDGLPFLDLLQLMPISGEDESPGRWLRFNRWLELWQQPKLINTQPVLAAYVRRFTLGPSVLRGLLLMQWVLHVADRVEARRADTRWMRVRVAEPLERLEGVLRG